jgi:membrane-bound lytic murein transglycosylase MltF
LTEQTDEFLGEKVPMWKRLKWQPTVTFGPSKSVYSSVLRQTGLILLVLAWLVVLGCGKPQASAPDRQAQKPESSQALVPSENAAATSSPTDLVLPTGFGKRTGDLDEMVKQRSIRALVIVNPIGFFYQGGQPHGVSYEALEEFQKFVNGKLKTGKLPVTVDFLPMRPDQLEASLHEGLGDLIAVQIAVTPGRQQRVAFSVPIQRNITQVIVTGSGLAKVSSLDDLAGKPIYVNPLSTYYDNLKQISEAQRKAGKLPLDIRTADKNLFDDDLIEMVNAGVIPATVANNERAELWAQVLPNVKTHPELIIGRVDETAWVMRKNNPQFKELVDEFVTSHTAGTSFGNTLLRRYLQNTKWIKNPTSAKENQKFNAYAELFKKYAAEYNFDYLMMVALSYQESELDQEKKSRVGAVGVMQVIPKLASAHPIDVPDITNADGNIHAGVKMLRNIADNYFNDPAITPVNKTLFTFASYNAGPNRIVRLRKKAQDDGLDPNEWFGNVDLEVAKDVGQETVTYVSNIYKYYIAYKLTVEQSQHSTALGSK